MAESRILEDFGEVKSRHVAGRSNAMAQRFVTQAIVRLFFARNSDVADGVFHRVAPTRATPR